MIRKTIIVVLTLAAVGILVLAVVGAGPVGWFDPLNRTQVKVTAAQLEFEHTRKLSKVELRAIPFRGRIQRAFEERGIRDIRFAGFRWSTTEQDFLSEVWVNTRVVLPLWMPFFILATYPALVFIIRGPLRRHRRRKRGLCATCGYDLRGSPDRCPECGTKIESP